MRFVILLPVALLILPVACEDDRPEPIPDSGPYCAVVELMDDVYCPSWREKSSEYAEGCYAAAFIVADERYNLGLDYSDLHPSSTTCLPE